MENKDQTSEETLLNEETSKETVGEGTPEKTTPIDYKEKFKASQDEAIKLRKEVDELKKSKETLEIPEDEKKLREVLSKVEKEKIEQEKKEGENLRKELDDLKEVYGEFEEKKLLEIVERYGVYTEEDTVNWDRAMELYQSLSKIPEAPIKKIPTGNRESSQIGEVEKPSDVSHKTMHELVQEGLKKLGFKE